MIEVAWFISRKQDAFRCRRQLLKGRHAERMQVPGAVFLGHRVKNSMTVIEFRWRAILKEDSLGLPAAVLFCENTYLKQEAKTMSVFKGAGVAIVTPMYEDETVNYDKLGEILDEQVARGTDAIIICGTTGEASTLSHEEHLDVIRYAVKKVNHRIPVVAGTGSNCTETAVYLSQEAEKAGADALLVVTPYYNKATQNGLKLHFSKIAESVKLPIILYNVPSRTGCNLQPETIAMACGTCGEHRRSKRGIRQHFTGCKADESCKRKH